MTIEETEQNMNIIHFCKMSILQSKVSIKHSVKHYYFCPALFVKQMQFQHHMNFNPMKECCRSSACMLNSMDAIFKTYH